MLDNRAVIEAKASGGASDTLPGAVCGQMRPEFQRQVMLLSLLQYPALRPDSETASGRNLDPKLRLAAALRRMHGLGRRPRAPSRGGSGAPPPAAHPFHCVTIHAPGSRERSCIIQASTETEGRRKGKGDRWRKGKVFSYLQ